SAYTFRLKIKRYLYTSLEYFPQLKRKNIKWDVNFHDKNNKSINQILNKYNTRIKAPLKFISGEDSASKSLNLFLKSKFNNYEKQRNDPTLDGQSNLSPHLHFGQISSQRVVLEFLKLKKLGDLKGSIYDEIIVRKELSDNFCYYNRLYDSFEGFPEWAKNSLNKHRMDKREYIYTLKDLECADTHDAAWNAAQVQMVKEGKMHGYMRMYWCKKILEWTESPEQALEYAQILNDKYELYGRDPNGYVGIAWSIGGVHDRAWPERNIFGKIRYMNFEGLRRKCNIQDYIDRYIY
ncbi:MAG: deoxyribodipyrimidine photolyase, partial [Candidatus Thorarchaeota archaeon]